MNFLNIGNLGEALVESLGPVAYPLLACSLVASVILIERVLILGYHTLSQRRVRSGVALMAEHEKEARALREELASLWLQRQARDLRQGIRILTIIALVAPLLGLLGTVMGLIQVFETLGVHQGPVEPSMLAAGLGVAMQTTAVGLIIAVPSVLGAQGFQAWGDALIQRLEHSLNLHNLEIEGVSTRALA